MDFSSLLDECLQLGIPVDITNLTKESKGQTENQFSEMHLKNLILTKKLEVSEQCRATKDQNFQKRLEEKDTKLKIREADISKLWKHFGEPSKKVPRRDDEYYDSFDWRQIASIFMPDPDTDSSPQMLDGLSSEESVPYYYPETQAPDVGTQVMVNLPASTSSSGEADPPEFQEHSSLDNVTNNQVENEDTGISGIQPDAKEEEERSDDIPASEVEEPIAQLLGGPSKDELNVGSDILSLKGTDNTSSEQAGSSRVSKTHRKLYPCSKTGCSKVCKGRRRLKRHIFSAHSKDPEVFKCGRCEYGYFSNERFEKHKNRRHRSKPNSKPQENRDEKRLSQD